eukprot:scaffold2507_cov122-Isochrysis_galbana.AAC.14
MAGSDAPSLSGFREGRAFKVLLLARDLPLPRGTPRELEVSFLKGEEYEGGGRYRGLGEIEESEC